MRTESAAQDCSEWSTQSSAGTTAPDHFMLWRFYPNGTFFSPGTERPGAGAGALVGSEERGDHVRQKRWERNKTEAEAERDRERLIHPLMRSELRLDDRDGQDRASSVLFKPRQICYSDDDLIGVGSTVDPRRLYTEVEPLGNGKSVGISRLALQAQARCCRSLHSSIVACNH